jgi:hypothetical protein
VLAAGALAFSPLAVHGAVTSTAVYAGHSPAAVGELLRELYRLTFALFIDASFSLPELNGMLRFELLKDVPGLLASLPQLFSWGPEHYLEGSQAFETLNLVIAVVKNMVSSAGWLLALMKWGTARATWR